MINEIKITKSNVAEDLDCYSIYVKINKLRFILELKVPCRVTNISNGKLTKPCNLSVYVTSSIFSPETEVYSIPALIRDTGTSVKLKKISIAESVTETEYGTGYRVSHSCIVLADSSLGDSKLISNNKINTSKLIKYIADNI